MNKENRFARVLIVNSDAKVLVIRQLSKGRHFHCFPGGKVETNETPKSAAQRELEEELGMRFSQSRLSFLCKKRLSFFNEEWIGYFYITTTTGISPSLLEFPKVNEARFLDLVEIEMLKDHVDEESMIGLVRDSMDLLSNIAQKTKNYEKGELFA